jgi:alkylation response protein AidB-like acyl-CoA dehydrogenase
MSESSDLIRGTVEEFCQKNIANRALEIERNGIDDGILQALGTQGFLGALFDPQDGGSGIDRSSFFAMLEVFASYSPSVAAKLLITNSIAGQFLLSASREKIQDVAQGNLKVTCLTGSFASARPPAQRLSESGGRIKGVLKNVPSPGSDILIAPVSEESAAVIFSGLRMVEERKPLSFRGLRNGDVSVDSDDFHIIEGWKKKTLDKILSTMDPGVSAIALGISRGALRKVSEYVTVRKTFDHSLKDYSPVSRKISELLADMDIMEFYLDNMESMDDEKALKLKLRSTEFARTSTKAAIQYHGGYGYFEDFGVEKFYRDSYGLSIMMMDREYDNLRLSEKIFGSRSGFL